jgi:beta-lactamase class A
MALQDELRTMLDSRAGRWGVFARHLVTGETLAIRADEVMPAQSSLKVCVLLTYTKTIRLGKDNRDRLVSLRAEDHELGSGILRYLSSGVSPTLDDLAWLMIVLSDNIATRALIRELGGAQVVETEMETLGVPHLRLRESPQDAAYRFMATPRDLAEVYAHLDDHAREILYRVERVFLARRVPHWPEAIDWGLTAPVRVYGKAGWGRECVDAGLFETDAGSWVVAAMGEDLPDLWHRSDDVGPRTLADIGELIYHVWGGEARPKTHA